MLQISTFHDTARGLLCKTVAAPGYKTSLFGNLIVQGFPSYGTKALCNIILRYYVIRAKPEYGHSIVLRHLISKARPRPSWKHLRLSEVKLVTSG